MEIYLDKRAVKQIRLSAQDAIEEGDIETLREDISRRSPRSRSRRSSDASTTATSSSS